MFYRHYSTKHLVHRNSTKFCKGPNFLITGVWGSGFFEIRRAVIYQFGNAHILQVSCIQTAYCYTIKFNRHYIFGEVRAIKLNNHNYKSLNKYKLQAFKLNTCLTSLLIHISYPTAHLFAGQIWPTGCHLNAPDPFALTQMQTQFTKYN